MKLITQREQLLKPLQHVIGVVERRQTLPILSNVLMTAKDRELTFTATDLEIELSARIELAIDELSEVTVPGRKLLDILRALPEGTTLSFSVEGDKALIRCGRSRFSLTTLPTADFPTLEDLPVEAHIQIPQRILKKLIERTHFAMAQQDVRYYLNGLLFEVGNDKLRAVATDGHRLAYCEVQTELEVPYSRQMIVPRKGIQELLRLLDKDDAAAILQISINHIRVLLDDIRFTSKLIDGKFPDYQRVIPRESERMVSADRSVLRNALNRTAILSNEKYRGIRLQLEDHLLRIQAHNPEQEEAEEEVEVVYTGEPLETGFNVTYLLDACGALSGELVNFFFTDSNNSCLIQEAESQACKYVVMPMRL